jgi:hypothetical protein
LNQHQNKSNDADNEIDLEEAGISSSLLRTLKATSGDLNADNNNDSVDPDDLLKNVSTLFRVDFDNLNSVLNGSKDVSNISSSSSLTGQRRRTPASAANQW